MTYYTQPHVTQFDGSWNEGEACVPTSCANAIGAVTGGRQKPSGSSIHKLIPKAQETDPNTPGWSLPDADHAMQRLTNIGTPMPFEVKTGWGQLQADRSSGRYLILPGDSDRFPDGTCSDAFDGDHCVGVSPNTKTIVGTEWWYIDDPICKQGRWERRSTLQAYAQKLTDRLHRPGIMYGLFGIVVPKLAAPPPPPPPPKEDPWVIFPQTLAHVVTTGNPTNVYSAPDLSARIPSTIEKGRVLAKYGGFPGWQFVLITYAGIKQYAWVTSDQVDADPTPLSCVNA